MSPLLHATRPPFLILAPISIFLGVAVSSLVITPSVVAVILILLGAISAHISVNTFNEYFDFRNGLDVKTIKTPFSGGSGALVDNPESANHVLYLAIVSFVLTMLIGMFLLMEHGLLILPIGIVGLLVIVTYTPWLNRFPFLCLFAPGLGFGPLMVMGADVILTGRYSLLALLVSLVPFFLANNLLLLNQLPDIDADKNVGRRHFPIVYGIGNSLLLYGLFMLAVCGVVIGLVLSGLLPAICLLSQLPMIMVPRIYSGIKKYQGDIQALIPFLGMNVFVVLSVPVLLGLTIIFG